MSETPNAADFSRNDKPGEYEARFSASGTIRVTILADNEADAKAKAEALMEDSLFGSELDDVDELYLDSVKRARPMYRVIRDGQVLQTSYLKPGDVPRKPNDDGFSEHEPRRSSRSIGCGSALAASSICKDQIMTNTAFIKYGDDWDELIDWSNGSDDNAPLGIAIACAMTVCFVLGVIVGLMF